MSDEFILKEDVCAEVRLSRMTNSIQNHLKKRHSSCNDRMRFSDLEFEFFTDLAGYHSVALLYMFEAEKESLDSINRPVGGARD